MTEFQELTNDLMVGYLVYDTLSEIFVMNSFDLLMLGHHVLGGLHMWLVALQIRACAPITT